MNLSKIKPKLKGESDKYSWNLYRFLNKIAKDKYINNQLRIYWNHHSRWDGEHLPFTKDVSNLMQLIISPYGDKFTGYFMNTVLQKGNCEFISLCPWKEEDLLDVTDWFFDTYEKIGRCIFDPEHNGWMLGTDSRYTYVNNTRKCNWCGQWHQKQIVKKTRIERKVEWV
ncbi:hypothetical protein GRF59_14730 [Paenibacillus sp. HJL G12]|uniref:Uncharacterized protein n=1 Tax=Paenibacillus dendrobii TaxID=2691084 RepID=A0A7X3IJ33_9BACL|nr:hypothetical protein [Paenibacillus dendrobii]MWV44874.1 hypothetical protein [Paenibacillus dendrobii]